MLGVAREVAAIADRKLTPPHIEPVAAVRHASSRSTRGAGALPALCRARDPRPRSAGAATPVWMRERLRRAGLRPISPIVDVTNYVMLELGQPMHAYDLRQLDRGIVVRMAESGERLTLLDGRDVTLDPDGLVIADAHGPGSCRRHGRRALRRRRRYDRRAARGRFLPARMRSPAARGATVS